MLRSRTVWMILGLALVLRLVAAGYWQRTAQAEGRLFRLGDSDSYWVLAGHLARGEPYQYGSEAASIFRAPLFPLVLAPLTWIEHPELAVGAARVVGCLLGTLAVWQLMLLADRLGGARAAVWAGAWAAVSPSAIGMSVLVLSEMLLVPLMLAHIGCWQAAWLARSDGVAAKWGLWAGVAAGLAILARPSWLLFTPFLLGCGLLWGPQRRRHLLIGVCTLAAISVCMSPWWLRNAHLTGHFVPTTLQVGPSLLDGLHAGATGASDEGMQFMSEIVAEQRRADSRSSEPLESTLEYRVNRRATREAVDWARAHPQQVAQLALAKFARTWSLWPNGGEIGSLPMRLAVTVNTFSVLLLALAEAWFFRRRRPKSTDAPASQGWPHGICWLPCIYFTLLHMVFVGSIRYREPGVFVLVALAGCAVASWLAPRRGATGEPTTESYQEVIR